MQEVRNWDSSLSADGPRDLCALKASRGSDYDAWHRWRRCTAANRFAFVFLRKDYRLCTCDCRLCTYYFYHFLWLSKCIKEFSFCFSTYSVTECIHCSFHISWSQLKAKTRGRLAHWKAQNLWIERCVPISINVLNFFDYRRCVYYLVLLFVKWMPDDFFALSHNARKTGD